MRGTLAQRQGAGAMMEVRADVFDIGMRLIHGDEVWHGDPSCELWFEPFYDDHGRMVKRETLDGRMVEGEFVVTRRDAFGAEYVALRADVCDHRILERMAMAEWTRADEILAAVFEQNARARAAATAKQEERIRSLADKFHWAINRDLGHRRQTPMYGRRT